MCFCSAVGEHFSGFQSSIDNSFKEPARVLLRTLLCTMSLTLLMLNIQMTHWRFTWFQVSLFGDRVVLWACQKCFFVCF